MAAGANQDRTVQRQSFGSNLYTAALPQVDCRTDCGGMSNTRPSSSDRRSLRYSACAQTSGIAEPDGRPKNSSRSGMSAASQICSGKRPLFAGEGLMVRHERSRRHPAAGGQLVVRALAGQQRPRAADAGAVERAAVLVLAVAVAVVAMPRRPARRLDLEHRIDRPAPC